MESIIWDTSIYITKLRNGYDWLDESSYMLVLSSVVAAELVTGYSHKSSAYKEFENYVLHMEKTNRLLNPSFLDWYNTGIIIGKIIKCRPDLKNKKALLFNDCLIAISSRQINAKVITSNIFDFELIRNYVNFKVSFNS